MRLDLTINIPTMLSLLALIVSVSATGVGLYHSIEKRQMATDYAVANLSARVEKAEAALSAIKLEQVAANNNLRTEVKQDLSEIKEQLNRLIFTPHEQRKQQLNEWSR